MCPALEKQRYAQRHGQLFDFRPPDKFVRMANSNGLENEDRRGARARWCDFSGPLDGGSHGGVALLDHPSNPRHPTAWHNWNNMMIMASLTFHDPLLLRKGQELDLFYRVFVHSGDARAADIQTAWRRFAATDPPRPA